jgi:hypothetical protein
VSERDKRCCQFPPLARWQASSESNCTWADMAIKLEHAPALPAGQRLLIGGRADPNANMSLSSVNLVLKCQS